VSGKDFAERSRAYFAGRFPKLMPAIANATSAASSVIERDGVAIDIQIDDRTIYGGDAKDFAERQVAAYLESPLRLYVNRLNNSGLVSPVCIRLVETLTKTLHEAGKDDVSLYPIGSPAFLVVFGLGLGHHLAELAQRTEARWLIIAEPLLEFFSHSFHVVDWQELIEGFEARGGSVYIVTDMDPARMKDVIMRFIGTNGIPYADGSWVFTHYPLWSFAEARKRLYEALEFAFINRGFFEDELRMMSNAVANFADYEFRLLEGRPRLRRPETAMIVGSGPSLGEGFDAIRGLRDRVVLFSCGTSLRPLLRNGIVPDFHCELENVPEVYDALVETAKFGDLSKITFVGSATVDPRIPALFGERIFYFRDSVSSTQILGGKYQEVPTTSPTCVNLGLCAAAFMGFTDLVLFGTDCGIRPGGRRHVDGTVYQEIGMLQQRERERSKSPSLELEGNFGGIVLTDWVYDACRIMLAGTIAQYRLNVVNCSDGAAIPGVRPCAPESFEIAGPAVDRAKFRSDLWRGMTHFAPGEIVREADLGAATGKMEEFFVRVGELVEELAAVEEPDFDVPFQRIEEFLKKIADQYGHTEAMVTGTLHALPRIAMFYGFRVAEGELRRMLYDLFMAEFRAIVEQMAKEIRLLFARLAETIEAPERLAG
jgi:hypothetical protein